MALNPDLFTTLYKPDVLMCLADLSNDEVFTPPDVANQVLDMLPQSLFRDPNTKFLDPALKSGVFLREIAKRLIAGLADKIPNLQERCDWIFKNQLYGIAITELTSLLGRRSVYCSKYPNTDYSISIDGQVKGFKYFDQFKYFAETSEVLRGEKKSRESAKERILSYNVGMSVHDVFAANQIYRFFADTEDGWKEITFPM